MIGGVGPADSSSVELGTFPSETGATKIKAAVDYRIGELVDLVTGNFALLPALEGTTPVAEGKLIWRPTRRWKDDQGNQHVHYRQHFLFSEPLNVLPEPYSFEGVPLSGGMLNLHNDNEGLLYFISGAYFEDIRVPTEMSLGTPIDALTQAWSALGDIDGHDMADFLSLDESTKEELLGFTQLKLVSIGDGKNFVFVWEVPAWLTNGASLRAVLDAATGNLLHFWDPNPHWIPSPCGPASIAGSTATADPQNPLLPDRTGMTATPSSATAGYTHEAHWPESSGAPVDIWGYRGKSTDGCAAIPWPQYYKLVPLPTEDQQPHYGGNQNDPHLIQKVAGDAVWKTYLTMDFFDDLDWDGFDDQGSVAKVVVGGYCSAGNAMFVRNPTDRAPTDSVLICHRKAAHDFSLAAALDVVAHEWGHGVIFEAVGWDDEGNDLQPVLHEGWADIIGHAVERHQESAGSGAETADWKYSEDLMADPNLDPERQVNKDDGVLVENDPPLEDENPYSYHANDDCSGDYPHYCGMPLAVAFWLAADGGTDDGLYEHFNPLCRRASPPAGVDCTLAVTPMGHWPATRVFFTALTTYIDETDEWEDFAMALKLSAHMLYRYNFGNGYCSNAIDKQDIVQDAFTAIGYEGTLPSYRYVQWWGCPN